jgi:hypothetical protein
MVDEILEIAEKAGGEIEKSAQTVHWRDTVVTFLI